MAYRISKPLAVTQFNDDKPKKKKKKTTTKTKTRTLRGMSLRQADKARSGSIDRAKTTTKTTVKKAPKSKSTKEKKTMLDKRIDRTIKRYNKKGIDTEGTRAAMERDSKSKARKDNRKSKKTQKAKDKARLANATPEEKARMNATAKQQKKTKRKTALRKIGLGKKDSQMASKNRKGRVDPNCGTAGQNKRATKESCEAPKNK